MDWFSMTERMPSVQPVAQPNQSTDWFSAIEKGGTGPVVREKPAPSPYAEPDAPSWLGRRWQDIEFKPGGDQMTALVEHHLVDQVGDNCRLDHRPCGVAEQAVGIECADQGSGSGFDGVTHLAQIDTEARFEVGRQGLGPKELVLGVVDAGRKDVESVLHGSP